MESGGEREGGREGESKRRWNGSISETRNPESLKKRVGLTHSKRRRVREHVGPFLHFHAQGAACAASDHGVRAYVAYVCAA